MELFQAHSQWSTRPNDERFHSLTALYSACKAYAAAAAEKIAYVDALRTEAIGEDVAVIGKGNVPAALTHWAFGQLSARVGAPANYLRALPPTLACQNLNHGLAQLKEDDTEKRVNLLLHFPTGTGTTETNLLLRAFTSDKYARIWNWEVAERLLSLESAGWRPARPTFNRLRDDEPPALYASDHDMFAFLMADNVYLPQPVPDVSTLPPLYRGVIVENSEVGASALKLTRFLFNAMCGNHIIWGASDVLEISVRHVGDARSRWGSYQYALRKYLESGTGEDADVISRARTRTIADTKEQVLDRLFGMRALNLSRKTLTSGYEAVVPEQDGDAHTVWGMVQGLTRYSQSIPYADQRVSVDKAAGKMLDMF